MALNIEQRELDETQRRVKNKKSQRPFGWPHVVRSQESGEIHKAENENQKEN